MNRYRRDIEAARERLAARERRTLEHPRWGVIEYTTWGEGPPMILSHPLFGGFDVGPGLAETYVGNYHRFVAPSRFGYLGSSLPRSATPADQADAYASILDALGIERAAIFGYSAGGPSVIQFALRHPDRTAALILMASALPGKAGKPPKIVAKAGVRIRRVVLGLETVRAVAVRANPRHAQGLSPDGCGAQAGDGRRGEPVPISAPQAGGTLRRLRLQSRCPTISTAGHLGTDADHQH